MQMKCLTRDKPCLKQQIANMTLPLSGQVLKHTTIALAMKGLILEMPFWNLDSVLLLEIQSLMGTSKTMRENSTLSCNSVIEMKKNC